MPKILSSSKLLFFIFILLVAIFLRLFQLQNTPPSPSLDEVTIGYNAYSILHTGKDEYGYSFPILLRAYDDYRPALYVYAVIPFVAAFGLSTISVRLPSLIMSILDVVAVYFLVMEILKFNGRKFSFKNETVALLAMLFLTVSPWHIYISRLGHEVNLGLFGIIFGILFFFRYLNSQTYSQILLATIFFCISLYGYQSEKIITPIILLVLIALFWERLWKNSRSVLLAICVGIILLLPLLFVSLTPQALIRFQGTSAFTQDNPIYQASLTKFTIAKSEHNIIGELLYNRRIVNEKIFVQNYFLHFNPMWLFTNGGKDMHKVPGFGVLYIWEGFLLVAGLIALFRFLNKRVAWFVVFWMLTSPLAAAITTQAPHALRSYTFLPELQIIEAFGVVYLLSILGNELFRKIAILLFSLIVATSLIIMSYNYFVIFPKTQSSSFEYALSKAVPYVIKHQNVYEHIVVSNENNLYQSYMFYLFFSKYNPSSYLTQGGTKSGGYAEQHTIGKYNFYPVNFLQVKPDSLIVGNPIDIPHTAHTLKIFNYLDGSLGVVIAAK